MENHRSVEGKTKRLTRKERKELGRRIWSANPGLDVVHRDAAGIDIGSREHYVAVGPDRDTGAVRVFGCFTADTLRSWTDDEKTKFFSGQAVYEKVVQIPESLAKPGVDLLIDFGKGTPVEPVISRAPGMRAWLESPVREAAQVYVNEQAAGAVWRPPYEVEVTRLLHAGANRIRIVAGNLAINELAGESVPDYKLLNLRFGERFTPQDMKDLQPLPAGLLGPIHLKAVER